MKYMLLIYTDPKLAAEMTEADGEALMGEYFAFTQAIVESGEMLGGDPLQPFDTATTVRTFNGERVTSDGPFAETKEVLGGYYIVDVADIDRALELAGQLPGCKRGVDAIEVRAVAELPPDMMPG